MNKNLHNNNSHEKYIIDYTNGSGSGCDKVFDTYEDAKFHMKIAYTENEREGLEIIEIEEEE